MGGVPVLVVIVGTIFAAAASPCTATADARPKPLVANLPASAEAQDFIRSRCDTTCRLRPATARECSKLLLPYAASINGSYIRASLTAATVMVSELVQLDRARPDYMLGGCVQMVEEAVGGAKEPLAELRRLDAVGDDKMGEFDLDGVGNWLQSVKKNFQQCYDGGLKKIVDLSRELPRAGVVENSIYASYALVWGATPYSLKFMGSPTP